MLMHMQTSPRRTHARPVASGSARRRTTKQLPPAQAATVPRSPYALAAVAVLGVSLLAGLAAMLVKEINSSNKANSEVVATYPAFFLRDEFKDWLATWKTFDPYLAPEEFRLVRKAPLSLTDAYSGIPVAPEEASRFVFAKDGIRYVDLLASYGEPDVRVDIGGLTEGNTRVTATYCGTACTFDRVFWTGTDSFVVLGTIESYKPDGTQLCSGEGEARICYKRLTATEYDLTAKEERVYESADRMVVTDPFAEEKSLAWFTSRPPEERVAAGIYKTTELVPFSGEVVSASHHLLGVRADNGTIVFVALNYGRVGTQIAQSDRGAFGTGAMIEGAGLRDGEKGLVATAITIKTPGMVFVHAPAPGEIMPRSFEASLSTLPSIAKVTLKVTDPQGEVIVNKTVSAVGKETPEGRQSVTVPVTLPASLDPEATCILSVTAQGSTASMTVPFVCGPAPTL